MQKLLAVCLLTLCWQDSITDGPSTGMEMESLQAVGAVPWLRRLVAYLSLRRPVFDPRPVYSKIVVDKVALEKVFVRVLRLCRQHHSTLVPS